MPKRDKITEARRHTPIRKGRFYCSEACGYKCTWAGYKRALKQGAEMKKALGNGWRISVYEAPDDWNVRVVHDKWQMGVRRCMSSNKYDAFILGGEYKGEGNTPLAALLAATKEAWEVGDRILKAVVALGKILEPKTNG